MSLEPAISFIYSICVYKDNSTNRRVAAWHKSYLQAEKWDIIKTLI